MRKGIILFGCIVLLCGCSNVNKASLDDLLIAASSTEYILFNTYRSGYKYYLPTGSNLVENSEYNDIITINNTKYYMYVDVISYINKTVKEYESDSNFYYSKKINIGEKFGFLQIKKFENEKYFIEIMYNYAKIEVIVEKKNINEAVTYSMSILSSIIYNDTILGSLMGDNILSTNEVIYNIFETASTESNYLQILEKYEENSENSSDIPDTDLIQ